ncbi:MAG: hypothetical protein KDE15_13495 [Erythrobacter sp.]|nr:hypothetical protein [Erythrobacter sp.]
MFDHSFFASKLGHAALVSVAAMVAFTVFAGMLPTPDTYSVVVGAPFVELA